MSNNWSKNNVRTSQLPSMLGLMPGRMLQQFMPMTLSCMKPFELFYQEMDQVAARAFRQFNVPAALNAATPVTSFNPQVDIASTDREYTLTIEAAGMDENDLRISVSQDRELCICGEKRLENDRQDKNFHRIERKYGAFERSLPLPQDADIDQIEATSRNGVLTITIPRQYMYQSQPRRIAINGSDESRQGRRQRSEGNDESMRDERGQRHQRADNSDEAQQRAESEAQPIPVQHGRKRAA